VYYKAGMTKYRIGSHWTTSDQIWSTWLN